MGVNPKTIEQFEDLWDSLDMSFAIDTTTVGCLRRHHEGSWAEEDDVSRYLTDTGLVLKASPQGVFHVDCPWKDNHTTPNTLTGTSYFAGGGFKCLHSHCANRTVQEYLAAIGYKHAGFENFTGMRNSGSQPVDFQLLTIEELGKYPPTLWCIKGVLPQQGLAAIYGPSGSGKSFLVLDLAMALALGKAWFRRRTKQTPVVYCALEGEGGVPQRVAAYQSRHGHGGETIRFLLRPFNLLAQLEVAALAKAIIDTGCGGGVTILDTLNRATPGIDENDSKDMGEIIAAAKQLQELIGGLVMLVHHTGKDPSKGLRGHSSLLAALDCAIEVAGDGNNRAWCVKKSKDGADGIAHRFGLEVVELSKDADGEPISSCVVIPDPDGESRLPKVTMPGGKNQRIILKAVRERLQRFMPAENEAHPECVPAGASYIRLQEAIAETYDLLTSQPDQRNRNARQAISALVDQGYLKHKGGYLWEP